jgi:hypothetical protein
MFFLFSKLRVSALLMGHKKAHYNKGRVNKVVLDHISTYKLNLIYCNVTTMGTHCINNKKQFETECWLCHVCVLFDAQYIERLFRVGIWSS